MPKFSKREVNYSLGHNDSHCGKVFEDDNGYCKNYRKGDDTHGTCALVEGKIKPVYWCEKFAKAR